MADRFTIVARVCVACDCSLGTASNSEMQTSLAANDTELQTYTDERQAERVNQAVLDFLTAQIESGHSLGLLAHSHYTNSAFRCCWN